jgi:MarR family transcriptional regulator, organic hydroperoxide resistance regulator
MSSVAPASAKTSPASEAWRLMHQLFRGHRGSFLATASEFGLSPPQVIALQILEPGKPVAMSALASSIGCDNSNVTGIIDRLEDRGLVERRGAAHDRRVKMLVVTDAGAEVRSQVLARLYEPPPALAALPAADQRALRDLLRRALGA